MKRSEINRIKTEAQAFISSFGAVLPPFADWTPEQMRSADADSIRAHGLGWDITDYGQGKFDELGLFVHAFLIQHTTIDFIHHQI